MRRATIALIWAAAAVSLVAQTAPSIGEWRYYGGSAASTRYSPLDQITRSNVNALEIAWRWTAPDNEIQKDNALVRAGAYQDTPLMINGVLYTQTGLGVFAAIDSAARRSSSTTPRSGKEAVRRTLASRTAAWPTGPTAPSGGSSAARTTHT